MHFLIWGLDQSLFSMGNQACLIQCSLGHVSVHVKLHLIWCLSSQLATDPRSWLLADKPWIDLSLVTCPKLSMMEACGKGYAPVWACLWWW